MLLCGDMSRYIILSAILALALQGPFVATGFSSFQDLEKALLQATLNEYGTRPLSLDPSGKAVSVGVQVTITDVQPIKQESIEVIVHVQALWYDERLRYNVTSGKPGTINKTLLYGLHDKVWRPDLYLEPEYTLNTDSGKMILRLVSSGYVIKNKRFRATIPCKKNLIGIQHTSFICTTRVMSYSYVEDEVKLHWFESDPVELKYGASDSGSEITRGLNSTCHWDTLSRMVTSCLEVKLFVTKRYSSVFYRIYLPSFMAVLMAWSSFWIHRDEASARIKLGTLVVWTVMTSYMSIEVAFPNYLDNTAGNVWMSGCMVFTWASFILYVIIHVIRRREKARLRHEEDKQKEKERKEKRTGERALSLSSIHPVKPISVVPRRYLTTVYNQKYIINSQEDLKNTEAGINGYSVWDNRHKLKLTKIYVSSFVLERWCRIWFGVLFACFTGFFIAYYGRDSSNSITKLL